ncbi:Transcription-repair-coupling factor [subsurface metagenome]
MDKVDDVEDIAYQFGDRFGTLPPEIEKLLYVVKIKALAAKAGIESISTEEGQIILRRFQGIPFNKQQLEPLLKDGIKIGFTQLRLNPKRLSDKWQQVLEEVLRKIR